MVRPKAVQTAFGFFVGCQYVLVGEWLILVTFGI